MDTFKIDLFREAHPGTSFPAFETLREDACRRIREAIAERVGVPGNADPILLLRRIGEVITPVPGGDPEAPDFNLRSTLEQAGIHAQGTIFINWYRFDQIDKMKLEDLSHYFDDIGGTSADDFEVFDETLDWIARVTHYGTVECAGLASVSPSRPLHLA